MDRQKLVQSMAGDDDMRVAAREALVAGAAFQIWDDSRVPVSVSISMLRRRQASAERNGRPILNFPEAIEDLRLYTGDTVMVGRIDDRQRSGMLFHLHLSPETEAVVSCLGVPRLVV